MAIIYRDTKKIQGGSVLDLAVSVAGLDIIVPAGVVTIGGMRSLDEVSVHTVTPHPTYSTAVQGFLVIHEDSVVVLVDEVVKDGEDESYRFGPGSPYTLLVMLYECMTPPGITDLDGVDVWVTRFVVEE